MQCMCSSLLGLLLYTLFVMLQKGVSEVAAALTAIFPPLHDHVHMILVCAAGCDKVRCRGRAQAEGHGTEAKHAVAAVVLTCHCSHLDSGHLISGKACRKR